LVQFLLQRGGQKAWAALLQHLVSGVGHVLPELFEPHHPRSQTFAVAAIHIFFDARFQHGDCFAPRRLLTTTCISNMCLKQTSAAAAAVVAAPKPITNCITFDAAL
jgi:hypothetical protein